MDKSNITPDQCRAARALVRVSQVELGEAAGVSKQLILEFERGSRVPHRNNLLAIQAALEAAGVVFIEENGGGAGVRLRDREV